jgi:hypothetical protein
MEENNFENNHNNQENINSKNNKKPQIKSIIALILVTIGLIIPIAGIFLILTGIILGFLAIKSNNEDNFALSAVIIGFITLIFSLIISLAVVIFLYVDFDATKPQEFDLGSKLKGNPSQSSIKGDQLTITFTYVGAKMIKVVGNNSEITNSDGEKICSYKSLKNVDSNEKDAPVFLNGQSGVIVFSCDKTYSSEEKFEGITKISILNPKTGIEIPSSGTIKLIPIE